MLFLISEFKVYQLIKKYSKYSFFILYLCCCVLYSQSEFYDEDVFPSNTRNIKHDEILPLISFDMIPDSNLIRKNIADKYFKADIDDVLKLEPKIQVDERGCGFRINVLNIKEKKQIAIVITPTDTEFSSIDKVPQGTWILYRDFETGNPVSVKIFPRENPQLYLNAYPAINKSQKGKTLLDICLFNAYVRKGIAIGISFDSFCFLSLSELRNITTKILPWEVFDPPIAYTGVESASDIIRDRLNTLVYIDDGGFDENGVPVKLKDGKIQSQDEIISQIQLEQKKIDVKGGVNCSGFAKWIVDGIIKPIAGQGTFINSLKTPVKVPDTYFTKPFENKDLYFGLEWIRNLASAALSLNTKRTVLPDASGVDVMIEPFALVPPISNDVFNNDFASFKGYEPNAGYQTNYLQAILYYLAVNEPGHFYLGVVNNDRGKAALRQYYHIAAFFPYFDLLGNFHIDVYESGEETSIEQFTEINKNSFTALVRIRAPQPGTFNP